MSTRGNICLSDAASPSLSSGLCPAHCTRDRSRARSRFYQRGAHNSRVACISAHLAGSLPRAPMRSLSPFFAVAFIGRAYTRIHHPVDSVPNGRFSLGRVPYASIVSSLAWPRSFLVESPFSPRVAMCATRARARVHAVYRSRRIRRETFLFSACTFARSVRDLRSISTRDGEARTCFFFSLRIIDRSSC